MKNKAMKNLIILGVIAFSFIFTNNVLAYSCYGYSCENSYRPYYNSYEPENWNTQNTPPTNIIIYPQAQQQPIYSPYMNSNQVATTTKPTVVNNYYYQNVPAKTSTTSTNTTTNNTVPNNTGSSNNGVSYNTGSNGLGASAYNSYGGATGNGITALSLRGSGSFMPSSIWQWIFVFILILIIIIIARMFVHKPTPGEHDTHAPHAH